MNSCAAGPLLLWRMVSSSWRARSSRACRSRAVRRRAAPWRADSSAAGAPRAWTGCRAAAKCAAIRSSRRKLSAPAQALILVPSCITRSRVTKPSPLNTPSTSTNSSCWFAARAHFFYTFSVTGERRFPTRRRPSNSSMRRGGNRRSGSPTPRTCEKNAECAESLKPHL